MAEPPEPPWRFLWYITEAGASEPFDFIEDLRESDFASYVFFLDNIHDPLLKNGPFALPKPYWEDLGGGFSEISWSGHRIYCCIEPPRRVFALVAVDKRWRAFASRRGKYVRLCEQRRADIRSGNYDEKKRNEAFQAHRARRGKK